VTNAEVHQTLDRICNDFKSIVTQKPKSMAGTPVSSACSRNSLNASTPGGAGRRAAIRSARARARREYLSAAVRFLLRRGVGQGVIGERARFVPNAGLL
jgi:hypothetical protein